MENKYGLIRTNKPYFGCILGAFWKDTKHNLAALGGLTPRQWPKQDKNYVVDEIPF